MMTNPKTLEVLIEEHGIYLLVKPGEYNPDFQGCSVWQVKVRRPGHAGRKVKTPFYMGSAHKGEPTVLAVMESLIMDVHGLNISSNFEEWATEIGWDTDSRRAERAYLQIRKARVALRSFLGKDYNAFMEADLSDL